MIYVVKAPTFILRILPPKKSVFLTSDNCLQTIPAGGICASQITKIARREGTTWNMSSPDGITPISIWVVFFLILTQWPLFSFCPRTKNACWFHLITFWSFLCSKTSLLCLEFGGANGLKGAENALPDEPSYTMNQMKWAKIVLLLEAVSVHNFRFVAM